MNSEASYTDAINFLFKRFKGQKRANGTKQFEEALKKTGLIEHTFFQDLEQFPYKVIVVGGTNGKGTVSASLSHLFSLNNKGVGLFTSPHLVSLTERIRINNKFISEEDFLKIFLKYKATIIEYDLSFFESLVIIGLEYFIKNQVDIMIFEVGLGGRYDATNFVPHRVSVLTKVGLDHQDILGHTIDSILENKLGIVFDSGTLHHLPIPNEAQTYFRKWSTTTKAKIKEAPILQFRVNKTGPVPKWEIEFDNKWYNTNLMGLRAVENLSLALNTFSHAYQNNLENLQVDLNIHWPGRMEKLENLTKASLYVSGDHNLQGITSLHDILKNFSYERLFLITGFSQQKSNELKELLSALCRLNPHLTVLTYFSEKSIDQSTLKSLCTDKTHYASSVQEALKLINQSSTERDLILVTGSLYLVGALKKYQDGK